MEEGAEIKANLILAIQTQDIDAIASALNSCKLSLLDLRDYSNNTIFHDLSCCIVPESDLLSFITQLKSYFFDISQYSQLINTKSLLEQQTALHIAVKHNKKKLVKEYLSLGGDFKLKDKNLQNVCHFAALYGKTALLSLFGGLGAGFEEKDIIGRLPLHLAAMEGNENTGLYLIANSDDFDVQDNDGMTPLHYAAVSNSYRIARHLVQKGANRLIKDKLGRIPLDIAKARGGDSMFPVLAIDGIYCKICPCNKPIEKITNSKKHLIAYILLFFIRYTLIFIILLPRQSLGLTFLIIFFFITGILFYLIVTLKDPGYLKTDPSLDLYETYKPEYICHYCKVLKTKNTRHCHYCASCVEEFDHHCPWIHNCVGLNNHKMFIIFLLTTNADFLFHTLLSFYTYFTVAPTPTIFPSSHLPQYLLIALGITLFLIFLLIFPLLYIQLSNLIQNKTTSQRFSFKNSNKMFTSDLLDGRMMLLPESDGWISQRNSEDFLIETNEKFCCFIRKKREKLSMSLNINI